MPRLFFVRKHYMKTLSESKRVNGMKLLKRMLCVLLCVVILSGTVGARYFDANHMEKVDAAAETVAVGLSVAALYAICFYVGTVAYAHAPIEMNTLTDDQIASMGYSTISYMAASNLLGIPAAPNAPLIGFIDKAGQSYVFGSEALKAVAATSFQVIQGGKKPDDDDDDDDEEGGIIDNLIQFPGNAKSLSGVCTAAFAGILGSVVKDQYSKFMDGEESIYQAAVEQNFTDSDIAKQLNGQYTANFSLMNNKYQCSICQTVTSCTFEGSKTLSFPAAIIVGSPDNYGRCSVHIMGKGGVAVRPDVQRFGCGHSIVVSSSTALRVHTVSANIPIFTSVEEAREYVASGIGYEDALNYAAEYRIADWLSEDWAGVLTDPLTGLQALGNWANIARHQGLSALGNELDLDSFKDYLRDFFANPGTSPGTDPQPAVDPSKAPVLFPSGGAEGALDPDTDIDPARDPVIFPDPSIKPKPDPDPGTDPDPKPDPDPAPLPDMNAADYKVELSGIFPFCIPFDFIALLRTLDAEPRAPCFTFPVVIPALSYREDVKLDLAIFDDVAKVIRLCEKVSFILFLMFVTSKVIRW